MSPAMARRSSPDMLSRFDMVSEILLRCLSLPLYTKRHPRTKGTASCKMTPLFIINLPKSLLFHSGICMSYVWKVSHFGESNPTKACLPPSWCPSPLWCCRIKRKCKVLMYRVSQLREGAPDSSPFHMPTLIDLNPPETFWNSAKILRNYTINSLENREKKVSQNILGIHAEWCN